MIFTVWLFLLPSSPIVLVVVLVLGLLVQPRARSKAHFCVAGAPGLKPWLKPWAELFCPFGAETLYLSLMSTRMGVARLERVLWTGGAGRAGTRVTMRGAAPDVNHRTSCRGSRGSASLPFA